MNRIYRLVFNRAKGIIQTTSELGSAGGKASGGANCGARHLGLLGDNRQGAWVMNFQAGSFPETTRKPSRIQALLGTTALAAALVAGPAEAQTVSIYTDTGSGLWSDVANWNNGIPTVAGDNASINGSVSTTGGSFSVGTLTVNNSGNTVGGSGTLTFDNNGSPATISANGGNVFVNPSSIVLAGETQITNGAVQINSPSTVISGTGSFTVTSGSSLNLGYPNTYSGGTTVNSGGTLFLQDNSAVGTGTLTVGGSVFALLSNVTLANNLNLAASTAPVLGATTGNTLRLDGAFVNNTSQVLHIGTTGTGGLDGTVEILANGGHYSSGLQVAVDAGTLRLISTQFASVLGNITRTTIASGATLDLNGFDTAVNNLTGSASGAIVTNNSTTTNAVLKTTGTSTFAGQITDGASMKTALEVLSGTSTLSGANTFSGGVTLTGGTLKVSSDSNLGAVSNSLVFDGGTLESAGTFTTTRAVTLNAASGNFNVDSGQTLTLGGVIDDGAGSYAVNKSGAGTLVLTKVNTYDGGTTVTGGTLTVNSDGALGNTAGGLTLDGGTLQWGSGFNSARSITLNAGGGTFDSNTYNVILSGGITGSGGLKKQGAGILTLNSPNTYTGDTVVNGGTLKTSGTGTLGSNSGAVTVNSGSVLDLGTLTQTQNGGVTLASGTIQNGTLNSSGMFVLGSGTVSAVLGGAGGVNKTTTGTVTLSGANTYTGGTTISAGTLVGNTTSLQGNIADNAALEFNQGSTGTFSSVISGTGAVAKTGAGTLTLTGANTYAGGTTISGGTLIGDTNSLQGNIADNAALEFNQGSTGTFSSVISGTGAVTKTGIGTLTLTGANTYTGGTAVSAGTLVGNTTSLQGNIADNAALEFNQSSTGTFSSVISGTGAVTKTGSGTLTLTGTNTYTGGTTVSAGTLVGNTTSLQGNITDNAALQFSQGSNGTFAGVVSGTGSVTKTGAGTVTLSGANTYTGSTKVSAGTLAAGAASAFSANSATTINTGATMDLGGFAQTVNTVALAGGTLTNGSLTGAITSTGGAISNLTGTSTLATTGGSTTTLSGTNAFGNITNAGTIINNGVGSDDLSNTGTFTNNATWTANIASNSGTIDNVSTGTWNNDVLSGANVAGGQIINQGTWNGTTSYNNGGILNNTGTWNGVIVNAAGTFTNTGTLSGNLTNAAGATTLLGNSGVIQGNVSNSGTLITNGAIGVMQVNGNYTQTSTGTLKIGVTPNAGSGPGVGYDQLNVSGAATLAGALAVQVGSGTYSLGTKYDIVHAGSVSGQFGTVSYEPSFASYITPQVSYTGTDAYLTLNPTQTAFSSGQGVNIAGWGTQLGLLNMQQGLLNVQGGTAGGILRVNHQPDPGAWARYLGGTGSSDGARLNNQAMLVGYGAEVRDGLVLGAAFTHTEDRTKTDAQRVKTQGTGLAVYGLFNHDAWFVDSALSAGHLHTDSNRTLQPTGLVASGNANGNYAGFLAKAGYRINSDRLFLTPYALVGYQYTHRNSFSESGAGLLNLTYAGQTSNLSIFGAGARIGTDWRIKDNLTLSPWIDLGAITYGGDRDQQQAVTLGAVGQVLQASGAPSVAGVVNAGVALMGGTNWSAQLAYRGQFGSQTHMNTADLKVVYRW